MELKPVVSSNIKSIGYDEKAKLLAIEFKNGHIYHYHEVADHEHNDLLSAESIGSHFHKHIRHKKYTKQ